MLVVCSCSNGSNGDCKSNPSRPPQRGGGGTDLKLTSTDGSRFTTDVLLKTTPVKTQGHSGLCWAYAMLAVIETEHLMQGDSVNLSPDFIARHMLADMADECYLTDGKSRPSLRGMATMLLGRMRRYGMLAYDTYHAPEGCNYEVLTRKVGSVADGARVMRKGLAECRSATARLLDDAIRPVPSYQFMFGAEYTTGEFARSVCRDNEYVALTSFTHHPFGERFALEVPDNCDGDRFLNVPVSQLLSIMVRAIRSGHPVCWEGDTSEPGFSFAKGVAEVDQHPSPITHHPKLQAERQRMFERFQTTDDHCMAIVGIAHDAAGKQYFVCKNSWGTDNPFGGMIYMSFDYAVLKTIAIVVPSSVFHHGNP